MWMASNNTDTQSMMNKILTYFRREIGAESKIMSDCMSIFLLKSDGDTS